MWYVTNSQDGKIIENQLFLWTDEVNYWVKETEARNAYTKLDTGSEYQVSIKDDDSLDSLADQAIYKPKDVSPSGRHYPGTVIFRAVHHIRFDQTKSRYIGLTTYSGIRHLVSQDRPGAYWHTIRDEMEILIAEVVEAVYDTGHIAANFECGFYGTMRAQSSNYKEAKLVQDEKLRKRNEKVALLTLIMEVLK